MGNHERKFDKTETLQLILKEGNVFKTKTLVLPHTSLKNLAGQTLGHILRCSIIDNKEKGFKD